MTHGGRADDEERRDRISLTGAECPTCIAMVIPLEYKVCSRLDELILNEVVHDQVLLPLLYTIDSMVTEHDTPRLLRLM